LLVGHTGRYKISAFRFDNDGQITELEGINLRSAALRGVVLMREQRPMKGEKKEEEVTYDGRRLKLPLGSPILVLDSEGSLYHYRYYDTRYAAPALRIFIRHLSLKEFKMKEAVAVKERLTAKKKTRCKSQMRKVKEEFENRDQAQNENKKAHERSKSELKVRMKPFSSYEIKRISYLILYF